MYNSSDVADRIKIIAKSKDISVKQLLLNVGLGFNTMSNMKTSMPKADNLAKIADYLNVSVDYLLGRTDIENSNIATPNSPTVPTLELNENESELLRIYRSLSVRSKNELMTAAYDIEDKKSST